MSDTDRHDLIWAVSQAQRAVPALKAMGASGRLDAIRSWARSWVANPLPVAKAIAPASGLSVPMAAWAVKTTCESIDSGLEALLVETLGDPTRLDGFCALGETSRTRAVPVPVVGHIWASTLPTSGWVPLVATLATGSTSIIKAPDTVRTAAEKLVQGLSAAAPQFVDSLHVFSWQGGDTEDELLARHVDGLVVSGGTDAIVRYGELTAHRSIPMVPFGPGCSVAVVPVGADLDSTAQGLALDIAAYDQLGCLSPQSVWVEGEVGEDLCTRLAAALDTLASELPRGPITDDVATTIMQRTSSTQFRGKVFPAADAVVLWEPKPYRLDTPLHRTILVHAYEGGTEGLLKALPMGLRLHGAAVAGECATRESYASALADLVVSRVTPPGRLQMPPATWHHDGMLWLGRLVRFVDAE